MMQPPRPAAWIAALLLVASLGFMPREGAAWDKQITPVIDPTNEGEPDEPGSGLVLKLPLYMTLFGRLIHVGSFQVHIAVSRTAVHSEAMRNTLTRGSIRK